MSEIENDHRNVNEPINISAHSEKKLAESAYDVSVRNRERERIGDAAEVRKTYDILVERRFAI